MDKGEVIGSVSCIENAGGFCKHFLKNNFVTAFLLLKMVKPAVIRKLLEVLFYPQKGYTTKFTRNRAIKHCSKRRISRCP